MNSVYVCHTLIKVIQINGKYDLAIKKRYILLLITLQGLVKVQSHCHFGWCVHVVHAQEIAIMKLMWRKKNYAKFDIQIQYKPSAPHKLYTHPVPVEEATVTRTLQMGPQVSNHINSFEHTNQVVHLFIFEGFLQHNVFHNLLIIHKDKRITTHKHGWLGKAIKHGSTGNIHVCWTE